MSDNYIVVHGTLKRSTTKAILIEVGDVEAWVPRSCCHFSTDRFVDDMTLGEEAEFKIMEWVAEKNGFI
jgi:hypothetical protein